MSEAASLILYVVVRKDLLKTLNWPLGAVITQACHAVSAALHKYREDSHVAEYLADLDNMRKVTLEVKNQEELEKLSRDMLAKGIGHVLWREMPENVPTALATKPYPKGELDPLLKKLQLLR